MTKTLEPLPQVSIQLASPTSGEVFSGFFPVGVFNPEVKSLVSIQLISRVVWLKPL